MVRLEVDAGVRDEQQSLDFYQWQDLFDVELSLELGLLADVLESALVELDLLVRHDSSSDIGIGSVVEALGHAKKDLLHFLRLVVE